MTRCIVALLAFALSLLPGTATAAASSQLVELAVELDPGTRRFTAIAQFEAPADFRMRLHRMFTVREVSVDDKRLAFKPPAINGDHAVWTLPLERTRKVKVSYDGVLPPLDRQLDHRSVLRSMRPMASPEGTFLPSSSLWYPRPGSLFSYRVTLTLPEGQRGLVPGDIVEEQPPTPASPRYRAVFVFPTPADGIDLMAGPYVIDERLVQRPGETPLRLRTYFTEPLRGLSNDYLNDSAAYIDRHARSIGRYPYNTFSVVESPLPTGFGMPTLTYIGGEVLKLPFIRATSLGHEILHNWWGNGVYADYASGNWSEGLTTFMADYAYKEAESATAARDMRVSWLRDFAATPPELQTALVQFRSRTHGAAAAVGYGKSAMLFFMLRDRIGNDAYDRGIREFWTRHRFTTASWQDLQRAFEQSSGQPLQQFFDQWLRRSDAPQIAVTDASTTRAGAGHQLTLTFTQAEPPYALRVPVSVVTGTREDRHWVDLDRGKQAVTLTLAARPDSVRFDPDVRVWRRLGASELPPILRQWISAAAPHYHVATADARFEKAATRLARRVFEAAPHAITQASLPGTRDPLLVIGLHADVEAALSALGLPGRPAILPDDASAWVWTVANEPARSRPVAVVSVRDVATLDALQRPLPHYGAQSYLAFDGGRVTARGVWPVASPLIPVFEK